MLKTQICVTRPQRVKVIQRLLTSSSSSSCNSSIFLFFFPSIMCFRRQFLDRMWLSFPSLFLLYVVNSCPHLLYVILLHFSQDRFNWSSPPFSNTTFKNIPDNSDLLFKVWKFQYHIQVPSNFSTLLFSSLNFSSIFWWKNPLIVESCLYHGNPGFNFTRGLQLASCYPNSLKIPHSRVVFDPVGKGEKSERRICARTWSWSLTFTQ